MKSNTRRCEACGNEFIMDKFDVSRKGRRQRKFCSIRCSKLGKFNPRWTGDSASKVAGHHRARRAYVEIGPCEKCGASPAERHHKDENTSNNAPSNIAILCRRCHMASDGRLERFTRSAATEGWKNGKRVARARQLTRTHCKNGHPYTTNSHGARKCRTCMAAASYKYWITHKDQMLQRQKARRRPEPPLFGED